MYFCEKNRFRLFPYVVKPVSHKNFDAEKRKAEFISAVKRFTTAANSRENICVAKIFREFYIS